MSFGSGFRYDELMLLVSGAIGMDFTKLKRQLMEAKKMAMPRTVIVWGSENLLGKAIESILGAAHNWKVVKIVDGLDVRALAREVNRLNPEIIWVCFI
jgi:hypothetical protein